MAIRFIRTSPVLPTCILPCPTSVGAPMKIAIPFTSEYVESGGNLSLKGGCSECAISIDLFAKINPYILSLQLPLCLVNCIVAVVDLGMKSTNLVTKSAKCITSLANVPPEVPSPSDLPSPEDLKEVFDAALVVPSAAGCKCVIDLFLPTGVCVFVKLVRDILVLVGGLLGCFGTLIGDIFKISFKAQIMSLSPSVRIRSAGICLGALAKRQLKDITLQLDAVWAILKLLKAVFTLIEAIPFPYIPGFNTSQGGYPDNLKLTVVLEKVQNFQLSAEDALPKELVNAVKEIRDASLTLRDLLFAIAAPLTLVVELLCP